MKTRNTLIISTALLVMTASQAFAQSSVVLQPTSRTQTQKDPDLEELNIIEVELDRSQPKKVEEVKPQVRKDRPAVPDNIDFSDLGKLAPFSEVSVIQKKYLPKTERFQVSGGLSLITNDPFFNSIGGNVNLGYFFTETFGIEGRYFLMNNSERQSTKELRDNNNVTTDSIATAKSFLGLDIMYVPIYGKMTWFNNKIVPYDLYFSGGYGTTQVEQNGTTTGAGTIHLAAGQIFALTKSWGFRWDFSWNFYQAKQISKDGTGGNSTFNNLYLTVGVSYFFPEAKYR